MTTLQQELDALISRLEKMTAGSHPVDHQFEEHPQKSGVCKHCGWIDPDNPDAETRWHTALATLTQAREQKEQLAS